MEIETQKSDTKKPKRDPLKKPNQLKKVDLDTAKLLEQIKDKANKKAFGRKVRDSEIIHIALSLISTEQIQKLQESTLSEKDKLNIAHEDYQKKNGKLTLDQFIGLLLKNKIQVQ